MDEIENFEDVWDNGMVSPASLSGDALDQFKNKTGVKRVIARQWIYKGKHYLTHYFVKILPDKSGFVHYKKNDPKSKKLVVMNPNLTERATISVPCIDRNSRPEKGYLSLPPSSSRFGNIEWGCEGSDGYTDYLFEFDWNTGKLLRYARSTRPW
jgi:hypothetical protein